MLLATLELPQGIRALTAQYTVKRRSLAGLVAALLSILGIPTLLARFFVSN